ncbi:MAG: L,D-transpeptidase, partial [Hyphomicrobiaceae bacterium]
MTCAIGRSGTRAGKREGDGATPEGRWKMEYLLYRSDKIRRPVAPFLVSGIALGDGWCDSPDDRNYNRKVQHPYAASAERLWRDDDLYDLIVVLDHNQRPRTRNGGSAVFLHVA